MSVHSQSSRSSRAGRVKNMTKIKLNSKSTLKEYEPTDDPLVFKEVCEGKVLIASFFDEMIKKDEKPLKIGSFALKHTLIQHEYRGSTDKLHVNLRDLNWDWRLWHHSIPMTIQMLVDKSDLRLVIFSNEPGATIGSHKFKLAQQRAV
jgi:hypothetical protein